MTKDKIELGFPTKAGYIGVKIPKEVAILGMKISTGWLIAFVVFMVFMIGAFWWYSTHESENPAISAGRDAGGHLR